MLRSETRKNSNVEQLALSIFQLLNRAETQFEAIDRILKEIKIFLDVSATAIRLEDEGDYPYYFFDGFSDIHIEMENSLCNEIIDGVPQLACMCGRVLMEKTDPDLSFFTEGGSFWTNNTNKLLEVTTLEAIGETRDVCNTEGYLSVALIPLKSSEGVIGLLQLNDEAQDKFSDDLITYLEGIGESIGIALSRLEEEDRRKELEIEQKKLLYHYQLRIRELDCLYRISKLQENQDLSIDDILNLIVNILTDSTQYPDLTVVRLTVENHVYASKDYKAPSQSYSAMIQSYGLVVGRLTIGYVEEKPETFKGPFLEEEIKLFNLVSETVSRMIERKKTGDWRKSLDRYALILDDDEMRHLIKLVLEDMAISEMDREEFNISDLPDDSTQSFDSYMSLQYNLELNRKLIIKLQNLFKGEEIL